MERETNEKGILWRFKVRIEKIEIREGRKKQRHRNGNKTEEQAKPMITYKITNKAIFFILMRNRERERGG